MNNIHIELDSYHKDINTVEYVMYPRATCEEFSIVTEGWHSIVKQMAKKLEEAGADTRRGLEIKRGSMTCFAVVPLDMWVNPPDRRPKQLQGKNRYGK